MDDYEVVDADGRTVYSSTGQAPESWQQQAADEFLYGAMSEKERAWRLTIVRIDQGYLTMLKELGVRKPKRPSFAAPRSALLRAWKAFKRYQANVTSIPRGSVSAKVRAQLADFEVAYKRIRALVVRARGKPSAAPRASQLRVEPKASAAPGFVRDLKDSFMLVGIIVGGAWLFIQAQKRD